jgi:hypothetical protein
MVQPLLAVLRLAVGKARLPAASLLREKHHDPSPQLRHV